MSATNESAVFCTSYLAGDPSRYQAWIDYYTEFFRARPVDLYMFNDGPADAVLDLKGVTLIDFPERLGRQSVWVFPGWKRSFQRAVRTLSYKCLAHVESDCFIRERGREEFCHYLTRDGYFAAWCKHYGFPEASLQIINSPGVRQYFADKYAWVDNLYENIDFEKDLERLKPTYIMDGNRIENDFARHSPDFNFLSGISYADFVRLNG